MEKDSLLYYNINNDCVINILKYSHSLKQNINSKKIISIERKRRMNFLSEVESFYKKYKKNYRLSKKDSERARDLLFHTFKNTDMHTEIINYMILLPENVGMRAYFNVYEYFDDKKLILESLTNNKILKENENQRSVKRLSYLIKLMSSKDYDYNNIIYIMRELNRIILIDQFEDSKMDVLDIFTYKEKNNNLKDELEEVKKENKNYKLQIEKLNKENKFLEDKLLDREHEINDLNNKINKLLEVNKTKDKSSLRQYKNKLAGVLKPDYKNIQEINDEDITAEMGEILKIKINEVYSKLIKHGIPLEE